MQASQFSRNGPSAKTVTIWATLRMDGAVRQTTRDAAWAWILLSAWRLQRYPALLRNAFAEVTRQRIDGLL